MKIPLIICVVLYWSCILFSQETTSNKLIIARCKANKNKFFSFKEGDVASMRIGDSIYIIPQILEIHYDIIKIKKRIYHSDTNIEWVILTFSIDNIKWINWDGIPRKKIRAKFYKFEIN